MSRPFVTIIVPCRNEKLNVEAAINSILDQRCVAGGFEVIVADGGSNDGTRELLDRLTANETRLRVINNPGKIVSTGLNAAICEAQGEVVIRMDTHTEYAPDYVACCLDVLNKTDAQNVGGPARTKAKTYFQKANSLAYHSPFSIGGARFHNTDYEGFVDTVTYGCWRKQTLLDLGLFDEELIRNQDDELNLRLIRSGGSIWQSPSIQSWYYPRSSLVELFKQYMQYGYWKVLVIKKHHLPASLRHLVPGGFVSVLLMLCILSFVLPYARWLLAVLLGIYIVTNLSASLITCRVPRNWKYLPVMPLVFSAYHFGYGWGFLRGVFDFLLLKQVSREKYSNLTR